MNDLISRHEAINEIEHHIRTAEQPYQLTDTDRIMNHAFEIAASCVYNLPAAERNCEECEAFNKTRLLIPQPERKTGHWEFDWRHDKATCSECGHTFKDAFDIDDWDNFCRHCGTRME